VILLPFVWLICAAFKDTTVLNEYAFLPPIHKISHSTINLDSFRTLFREKQTVQGSVSFWRYIWNSIFLATAGTSISLVFSSMGGYALAKYRFAGRGFLLSYMLASMTIPGVVLLAPNFEVMWRLGWLDSYKAILIPGSVGAFGIFLFRQAMLKVPDDLIEAGRIDGCSELGIYFQLVMPLVRPMSAAFCLISFLGAWNSFLVPNIFLQTQSKLTLPVILNQYIGEYTQQYGVFLAGTLLAIIPPAILFFALQREFISGLTSGAVKQ
jgi:ABC-type glycerol-3-phosphate transport system permease component